MVAVPMWRKDQSPAITSPLGGKCREAGRVTCQQEGRRAIAVLTSAWFCLMATVRPRKVCLQNRQHAVVLHCWELPGHQSGQFIHGHFCRRKLHVDALQLQRGRLMEHSEAQFKALNVLRANLPRGQSALSGTTHRAGLAGEWSSWAQNMGQVHRKAFHLCFSVWASKTWSSSENQLLCNWIYCDLYSASRDLLGVYPKRAAMLLKGELSPLDCSMTLQWHFRFIKSLRMDEQEVELRYEPFASTSPTLTCFELGTGKKNTQVQRLGNAVAAYFL